VAKVIWKGEDFLHIKEDGSGQGPRFTTAFGDIRFEKGKPTIVTDLSILRRAVRHPSFEVELTATEQRELDAKSPAVEPPPEPADHAPDVPKRRPGRPPRVKPNAVDQNAA